MKQKLIAGVVIALLSTTAYASIKDKKAMRAADANITTQVTKVKAACGELQGGPYQTLIPGK